MNRKKHSLNQTPCKSKFARTRRWLSGEGENLRSFLQILFFKIACSFLVKILRKKKINKIICPECYSIPLFSKIKGIEEKEKFLNVQNRIQNIPVQDLLSLKKLKISKKHGCSIYPDILNDVEYRNTYWQIFTIYDSTYHLYSAYLGKTFAIKMYSTQCKLFFQTFSQILSEV